MGCHSAMEACPRNSSPTAAHDLATLRFVRGRAVAELVPGFVARLSEFALQQRFAAHHDRAAVVGMLQTLAGEPPPSRSFMALDAGGTPVAHLHAAYQGRVGEAGWPLLEIARVVAEVGLGHGSRLLEHARAQLGAALLCSFSNLANPRLFALARQAFPLVYSTRVSGLLNLPAALLRAQPPQRLRDAHRARCLQAAALQLSVPCHVAAHSPWQPVESDDLQHLWQRCHGDWRKLEERLVARAAERLRRLELPHTAKVLPEAYRAAYGRPLEGPRFRELAIVQRRRIVSGLVRDGVLR